MLGSSFLLYGFERDVELGRLVMGEVGCRIVRLVGRRIPWRL